MNETLRSVDNRPVLRIERRLAHPVEKVWRTITEPAHLSQWYPFQVTAMDLRVGGTIRFEAGQDTRMDAVITELTPPHIFAFSERAPAEMPRESNDLIHFELRPDSAGCRLIFTEVFDDRPAAASYASGWQVSFDALEMVSDGQPVVWSSSSPELHEAYIAAFALNQSLAKETPNGWQVRFERQLTTSIDGVWTTHYIHPRTHLRSAVRHLRALPQRQSHLAHSL